MSILDNFILEMESFPEEFDYRSEKEYYYVSGDAQSIYFDGSDKAIEFLRKNLVLRPNTRKKLFLKLLPYWKYNPLKDVRALPFDSKANFPGNIVLKASRTVSFDFENSRVVRTDIEKPYEEKEFREKLIKNNINTPKITLTSESYMEEELVDTRRLSSLKEDNYVIKEAYKDLLCFYSINGVEENREGVYEVLLHGDFKLANVGISYSETYIFDWERRRRGPLFYDILKFLWVEYKHDRVFYGDVLIDLVDLTVEELDIDDKKVSKNVLYSLEELMKGKNYSRAEEFYREVEKIYG